VQGLVYAHQQGNARNGVLAENALIGAASPRMQRRGGDPAEKTAMTLPSERVSLKGRVLRT
jgi:hypothetical protein